VQRTAPCRSRQARATAAGLAEIASYADGAGANKLYIIPRNTDGTLGAPTSLVADAHAAGLEVHPWTFRAENTFLPTEFRSSGDPAQLGDLQGELKAYLATGIDGFFTDHPDIAAIPEPHEYALMLTGLALVGAAVRRRRSARPLSPHCPLDANCM
jgi:glycerophosphoryl diester phosphodiesterase